MVSVKHLTTLLLLTTVSQLWCFRAGVWKHEAILGQMHITRLVHTPHLHVSSSVS